MYGFVKLILKYMCGWNISSDVKLVKHRTAFPYKCFKFMFSSDSIRQGSARTEIYILKYSPKNSQNFIDATPTITWLSGNLSIWVPWEG